MSSTSRFLGNKKRLPPLFHRSGGLTSLVKRGTNGTESVDMGLVQSTFLPQKQVSYRLQPSTPTPTTIGGTNGSQVNFQFSSTENVHNVNSVRIDLTFVNGTGVSVPMAPSPFFFESSSMSLSSSSSVPFFDQRSQDYCHQLMLYEEQEAVRILRESNFRGVGPYGEIAISQSEIVGPPAGVISNFHSPLEAGADLAIGETRTISYYLMDSPLECSGFSPLFLRDTTTSITISFNFASNFLTWAAAAGAAVQIQNVNLTIEGTKMDPIAAEGVKRALCRPNINIALSYTRPIRSVETFATLSDTTEYTVVLREMVGIFSYLSFAIWNDGTTTSANGKNSLIQSYSPQADNTASGTVTPGTVGGIYQVSNFNFLKSGSVVEDSIRLTSDQLNQRGLCSTQEKSFLLNYYPAMYLYSFSNNALEDGHYNPGCLHGVSYLDSTNAIQFTPGTTIATPTRMVVTGRLCCELVYSTDASGRGMLEAVTSTGM